MRRKKVPEIILRKRNPVLLPFVDSLVFETCLKLCKLQWKSNFNRNEVHLLMIENFESNQIFLYLPGGYMMHFHLNLFLVPLHHLFAPVSHKLKKKRSIINTVTSHMSLFNHSQTVRARDLETRRSRPHWKQTLKRLASPLGPKKRKEKKVTCDMWHLTDDMWHVTGGGSEPALKISGP